MAPTISFQCPMCRARIKAPIQLLGQWRTCPGCSGRFVVRMQPPQDSGPVLIGEEQPEEPQLVGSS